MKVVKIKSNCLEMKNIKNSIIILSLQFRYYIYFVNNGKLHNENFPAEFVVVNYQTDKRYHYVEKAYFYNNNYYGAFKSVKQWQKQIKHINRQNKLKVFL